MKIVTALALSICAQNAFAALGGLPSFDASTVSSATILGSTSAASYTYVKKTTLESGTQVLEYMNADGIVFGVSWSGPYLPDLQEVLGAHFQSLVQQAGKRPHGVRSQLAVKQADVVIFSGGRMGAFEGKAWVPALLPAGFNPGDIK